MCLELQFGILQGIELVVPAVLVQQLLMVALLDDLTLAQQDDIIGCILVANKKQGFL